MTVKIRQLTRTTRGGIVPPPPPPPPTMSFLQQPTDTQIGDPFNPPITVSISTGASDSLTIYSYSGCAFSPTTITAVNGTGTFTGLIAQTVGMGCRFGVHNNSNPDIADIVSMPFNVTAPVVPAWRFVRSAAVVTSDNVRCVVPFNYSGVKLVAIVFQCYIVQNPVPPIIVTDNATPPSTFTPLTAVRVTPARSTQLQIWYMVNPAQNTNVTIFAESGAPVTQLTYPAVVVLAFDADGTPVFRIEGSNTAPNGSQLLASATPPNINFNDALIISGFNNAEGFLPSIPNPPGFNIVSARVPGVDDITVDGAWKILPPGPSTDNPLWTIPAASNALFAALSVFQSV